MNSTDVIKKRNHIFILFLFILIIFSVAIFLVFSRIKDYNTMTLINILLLFALALITLKFRDVLYNYNNLARIAKVINLQSEPITFTNNIVEEHGKLRKNYTLFTSTKAYHIYYHHFKDMTPNVRKNYCIEIIAIIHDPEFDFYDKGLHEDISKLETIFNKKEAPNKYVILAFKSFDMINETRVKEIGEVVSYRVNRHSFTQINVGLSTQEQLAYFLYSKNYYPNKTYMDAVNLVFKLTDNPIPDEISNFSRKSIKKT